MTGRIVILALLAASAASAGPRFGGGKVDWTRNKGLEELFPAAREAGKYIVAYFTADWEPACSQLDGGAFSDDAVVKESESYIRVLVDCTDTKVLEKYRKAVPNFKDVPAVYFIHGSGVIVDSVFGAAEPAALLKKLKEVRERPAPTPQAQQPQPNDPRPIIERISKAVGARLEKELEDSEEDLVRDIQRIVRRELQGYFQRHSQPQRPPPNPTPTPQPKRGVYLGVKSELFTDAQRKDLGLEAGMGLRISEVTKDGPADKGGVLAGDILVQIGTAAITEHNIGDVISAYKAGDKADVIVIRAKERKTLNIVFTERK